MECRKYNVLFDANGAKGNMSMLKDVEYDSEFLAPDSEFMMEGYHFTGWSVSENGQAGIYKAGDKIKNLTQNGGQTVKLYAQWDENSYSIEYNLNGGVGKILKVYLYYIMTITLYLKIREQRNIMYLRDGIQDMTEEEKVLVQGSM